MRLRIAYEATALLGNRTGVGEFCYGALNALADIDDFEITAFAMSFRRRHLLKTELPPKVRFGDWIMPARPLNSLWQRVDMPPLELWSGGIDVVHGTNFIVPPTLKAAKVITVHDLTTVRFPEICNPPTLVYPHMIRRAIASGALLHTPSEYVRDEVLDYFDIEPERVVAVHHGIPLDWIDFDQEKAPSLPNLVGRRFVLGLGTIEPRKDFPLLVRAFDELSTEYNDVDLVIAGQDGWGSDQLEAEISRSSHRNKIFKMGYVSPSTRKWLLTNASVFAYPSVYEGFGFPPLEAMALGTPVVASRAGALPEVLGGNAARLFDVGDQGELERSLADLLSSETVRANYAEAGKLRAKDYSWTHCATGLASLYRSAREIIR